MPTPSLHRVAPFLLAGVVALLGATSGCTTSGVRTAGAPVPVRYLVPEPAGTAAPTPTTSEAPVPAESKTTTTKEAAAKTTTEEAKPEATKATGSERRNGCEGAVVHTVDGSAPGPHHLCIAGGGIVRITGFGPGDSVNARPASMVDCFYGGGVRECRLLRAGKVRFAMDGRTVTVRVPEAVPGQPTTACEQPGSVSDLDTTGEFMWSAPCLRVGATLRVLHLGPGLLRVAPAAAVDCSYDAAAYNCTIRKAATLVVTAELAQDDRVVSVVAIR